jgi:hypothetical protein
MAETFQRVPDQVIDVRKVLDTSGISTEAKQDDGNTKLSSIDTKLTDNATSAKQDEVITKLGEVTTNQESTIIQSGTQDVSVTKDIDAIQLLTEILQELKINNAYLAEWQGYAIKKQDIS